jgi:hypothetical protein
MHGRALDNAEAKGKGEGEGKDKKPKSSTGAAKPGQIGNYSL